ncbi:hypothetical protein BHM03_00060057 [Ensete ventricosum]|nr:hypothetical protein BHM03_00060057 [Ensete ventricosum]
MAAALATALHSFLSTIYPFRFQRSHPKSYSNTYYYNSTSSGSSTSAGTRKMTKGKPLSLQVLFLPMRNNFALSLSLSHTKHTHNISTLSSADGGAQSEDVLHRLRAGCQTCSSKAQR